MPNLFPDFTELKILLFLFIFLAFAWSLVPFAIFGIKKRLDEQIKIGNKLISYHEALHEYLKNVRDNKPASPPLEKPE